MARMRRAETENLKLWKEAEEVRWLAIENEQKAEKAEHRADKMEWGGDKSGVVFFCYFLHFMINFHFYPSHYHTSTS
mgnify:CR=1 FL=1